MPQSGELLTRATVWIALTLYVGGEIARRLSAVNGLGRLLNTLGCAVFLAHVACAFQFYHSWSHAEAYAATARQTADRVGWNSGFGLYINYLFGAVWLADAVWSWTTTYAARSRWLTGTIRAFFWFMIFNGAVVFAHGPLRILGVLLSLTLIACWCPQRRGRSSDPMRSL